MHPADLASQDLIGICLLVKLDMGHPGNRFNWVTLPAMARHKA